MKSSEFESVREAKAIVHNLLSFYREMMRIKDMSTELEQAIAAREALHAEIKSSGTPPHTDYWHQSLADADERVRLAQEAKAVDCYGMTPEERAEFEAWLLRAFPDATHDKATHDKCLAWAACAKPYLEKLQDAERQRDDAKARLDELVLLYAERRERVNTRIKELEAENARLRADAARLDWLTRWFPGEIMRELLKEKWMRGEVTEVLAAIDAAMKGGE
jgi:hypothetical protein